MEIGRLSILAVFLLTLMFVLLAAMKELYANATRPWASGEALRYFLFYFEAANG